MPKTEKAAPAQDENGSAPKKSIPEGTVLGDGHIKYVLLPLVNSYHLQ